MRRKIYSTLILAALFVALIELLARSGQNDNGRPGSQTKVYTNAVDLIKAQADEINARSRLLYELAAERYSVNTKSNKKWVLTMHHGRKIRRYTDGNYTVVSLPIFEPGDEPALCNYCTHYNSLAARAADLKAQAGEYTEAKRFYKLLVHFDCGDLKKDYERKLTYLDKLERKEDVEVNLKKFMELSIPLGLTVDFSEIEKIQPIAVTNLLEIKLP